MVSVAERDDTAVVIGGPVPAKTCRDCGRAGEWPGQPCAQCRAGVFEPVSLAVLAEHLRDGTWLDLRTEDGLVQRVRVTEIIVSVDHDDVRLFQQWFDDDYSFNKRSFAIDAEAIRRVQPTACQRVSEVVPWVADMRDDTTPVIFNAETEQELLQCVLASALFMFDVKLNELRATREIGPTEVTQRYACLIVLYEMSNLHPKDICEALGYSKGSVQALISARYDMCGANPVQERIDATKRLGKLVDQRMPRKCRTSRAFPRDYSPLLGR